MPLHTAAPARTSSWARTALQVTAILCTLEVLFQGSTAGQIITGNEAAVDQHGAGAIVFHVLSGLMLISAALLWLSVRGSWWPTVLSALVFVAGLVQAYLGDSGALTAHVPLALALMLGTAVMLVWSFVGGRGAARVV